MNESSSPGRAEARNSTLRPGVHAPGHRIARRIRASALTLLILWIGPVTFGPGGSCGPLLEWGVPTRASAVQNLVAPRSMATLDPGVRVKLRMRNGTVIQGRYMGRDLLEPEIYAERFAEHAASATYAPLQLGETLHVSLQDGRQRSGPFAGYGDRSLIMSGPDDTGPIRVPVESILSLHRSSDERVDLRGLGRALRANSLPSAEALVIEATDALGSHDERWQRAARIGVSDIQSAGVAGTGSNDGSPLVGGIILGVVAGVLLAFVMLGLALNEASRNCGSHAVVVPAGLTPTTRPFDLDRGTYQGDPLATCGPWREAAQPAPAVAVAGH